MQSTTDSTGNEGNWPLHSISEVHASNDVVLDEYETSMTDSQPTFRSTELRHPGNRRFHQLLLDYKDDYANRSAMEKPLVTLQILHLWRNQSPKGRFLVQEHDSNPPLYKDVGDKKARSKISKALKKLLFNKTSLTTDEAVQKADRLDDNPKPHHEPEEITESTKSLSSSSSSSAGESSLPSVPETQQSVLSSLSPRPLPSLSIPRPQTGVTRTVSQALKPPNQKLYGRQDEYDQLERIFQGCHHSSVANFVLIKGPMGVGKTALAQQAVETWCHQKALQSGHPDEVQEEENLKEGEPFFLQTKFQQFKWNLPNAVYVDVVTAFCEQLEARNDAKLKRRYQERIRSLLEQDLSLLMHLVPSFRDLMAENNNNNNNNATLLKRDSSSGEALAGSERSSTSGDAYENIAAHRVQMVLSLFFRAITDASPNHKIFVLLEDLHFASEASVEMFSSLLSGEKTSPTGVLFMGTHRTQQTLKPYLLKRLGQLKSCSCVQYDEIILENLTQAALQSMLADALNLVAHETQLLTDLVYGLTKGNPAFITEVLRMLQADGALYFDEDSKQWTCDLADFGICSKSVQNVEDLWIRKVHALPADVQVTMKYAACLLTPFLKESLLKVILPTAPVCSHLEAAEAMGLVRFEEAGVWVFPNDGVIQAVYNMIPEPERPSFHLQIGQKIWAECGGCDTDCILLIQLWLGHHLISQEEDLRTIAALFLNTGKMAAKCMGFQTAWYAMTGAMSMVSKLKDTWGRNNYDLSLSIYNTAIEVCYINGEYSGELERLITEVMKHARTFEDSLVARTTLVKMLGTQDKKKEAMELALDTLEKLGESFPRKPSRAHVASAYRKVRRLLKGKSDDDILALPRMRNRQKIAAQQMLAQAYLHAAQTSVYLTDLFSIRMLELTIEYGISAMSSMGFGVYSIMLSSFGHEESFRYGRLALRICDVFKSDVWFCRSAAAFYGKVYCYKKPIRDTAKPLFDARRAAFRSGDIEFAMLIGVIELWNLGPFLALPDVERKCRGLHSDGVFHGQSLKVLPLEPMRLFAVKLMGCSGGDPKILDGESLNKDFEAFKNGAHHQWMMRWVYLFSMKLAYLFGDLDLAYCHSQYSSELYTTGALSFTYKCLVLLGQARRGKRKLHNIWTARKLLKKVEKLAAGCPENFLGKQCLLEAELAWTYGKIAKAKSLFRLAILQSRDQGFWLEEALANEQLGKLYLEQKGNEDAIPYLREAQRVYERWGANAKVHHIEGLYGALWHR